VHGLVSPGTFGAFCDHLGAMVYGGLIRNRSFTRCASGGCMEPLPLVHVLRCFHPNFRIILHWCRRRIRRPRALVWVTRRGLYLVSPV
jgi:hypothetical protein